MVLHVSTWPWAPVKGTRPDSRVASNVGGMAQILVEMARRSPPLSPFLTRREGLRCCEVRGIWPISQARAPNTAAQWVGRPEYRCLPHTRNGVV